MTVGEKIQFYRKKNGLSQEELGQKMLVSRQTISQWEMDRTLPTVDNLRLLSEIFSIPVDDILSEREPGDERTAPSAEPVKPVEPVESEEPREEYTVRLDENDVRIIYGKVRTKRVIQRVVLAVVFALVLCIFHSNYFVVGCYVMLLVLNLCYLIKEMKIINKGIKTAVNRVPQCTYSYKVYDGYFNLEIFRDGEMVRYQKVRFSDIDKIQVIDNYMMLMFLGQSFFLRMNDVPQSSAFVARSKEMARDKKNKGAKKTKEPKERHHRR